MLNCKARFWMIAMLLLALSFMALAGAEEQMVLELPEFDLSVDEASSGTEPAQAGNVVEPLPATMPTIEEVGAEEAGGAFAVAAPEPAPKLALSLELTEKKAKAEMNVGDTLQIVVNDGETGAFTSKKAKVAAVDANGLVTALIKGSAKIEFKPDGGKKRTLSLKVNDPYECRGISIADGKKLTLSMGSACQLTAVLSPSTAQTTLTWSSSKTKAAVVDGNGVVSGLSEGKVKITVRTANKKKATITVYVIDPYKPDSVAIAQGQAAALMEGETLQLDAVLSPATAVTTLTWKSSKPKVATVDENGLVTAIGKGKTKITVSTANGKKAKCSVAVSRASAPDTWELTQHPDDSGNVGMFYSLRNQRTGSLILIDGGNPENAGRVRQVIEDNGGKVDYWFLTHYHGDHISAFNALWPEYRDRIGTVYVNPLDWQSFESVAKYWDTPEAFSGFLELTADANNVVTLHTGDKLDIEGVHVRVFSAFDEHVKELSTDWPNDSSLVMKFTFAEDSLLIMGDLARLGIPLGEYLVATYGDELRADYVQAGHHGNWGQPIAFYEAVQPRVLFQDAPEYVMVGENYDAKDLKSWCAEHGIETHDFRDAPTSFILK